MPTPLIFINAVFLLPSPDVDAVAGARAMACYDWDAAIAAFSRQLKRQPRNAWAYTNRGYSYSVKGDEGRALGDYTQVIRLEPDDAVAYYNRGNLLLTMNVHDRALADLNESLRLAPGYGPAYVVRASAFLDKRDYARALTDYRTAERLDARDPYALWGLAWVLATCPDAKLRDGAKAVEYAKQAHALWDKRRPEPLDVMAAAFAEAGRFDEAVTWQRQAIEKKRQAGKDVAHFVNMLSGFEVGRPYRSAATREEGK